MPNSPTRNPAASDHAHGAERPPHAELVAACRHLGLTAAELQLLKVVGSLLAEQKVEFRARIVRLEQLLLDRTT
jgi:hypothetical protein